MITLGAASLVLVSTVALGVVPTDSPDIWSNWDQGAVRVGGELSDRKYEESKRSVRPASDAPADSGAEDLPRFELDVPVMVGIPPGAFTESDLRSLPIQTGTLSVQPAAARVLINMPTIAYSTAQAHTLATTVLGAPVTVRVWPVEWRWDFGGGTQPFSTTDGGGPWPEDSVSATYTRVAENLAVRVVVTWRAEYRIAGSGAWQPVDGTATTTAVSVPFATYEAPARLVSDTLER